MFLRIMAVTGLLALRFVGSLSAQQSPDGLWKITSAEESQRMTTAANAAFADEPKAARKFLPPAFKLFELEPDALLRVTANAINERVNAAAALTDRQITIFLPTPDGAFREFQLIESPVLSPGLQEKFPKLRAYRGQCLDDRTMSMRLDIAPRNDSLVLRAQIHGPEGTVLIDPFGDGNQHMSFVKERSRQVANPANRCLVEPNPEKMRAASNQRRTANARFQSGTQLRTYRLAIACTGEYTQFHGGTKDNAMAAIHNTINRVNEVYERDVAIRFELVDNIDQLIFTDGTTDPFNNGNAEVLVNQSQSQIDSKIGDVNYDVGHTFSTGAGGYAPGPVGVTGQKAMGVTGQSSPVGDPFDIDYVAHEIGHQLNGDHTFNGTGCLSGARFGPTAVEPGSGSTILAYAGICVGDNLQSSSNDYFHSISVNQIIDYSSTGPGAVGTVRSSGNRIPIVESGANFSIPKLTPFKLTATASDPDGDPLTYCWEQIDTGPAASANTPDDGKFPLFRSFAPTADRNRVFPKWSDILSGTQSTGEQLPSKARTMHFQVTVRDNRSGGGGISNSTPAQVNVVATAGPFRVTSPLTTSLPTSLVDVRWDVAMTDKPPIKCDLVNIRLSTDGGQSFPQTLASNTANDGNELVAIPATAQNNLRILVESVGGLFFAVNTASFSVEATERRIFLTRHAEKASGTDPDLTPNGRSRAQVLANLMAGSGVTHVFSSDTRRTRQTAQPTSVATGQPIEIYDTPAVLASKIKSLPRGTNVLVVGHSDTLGEIGASLGVDSQIQIDEAAFDNLFVVGLQGQQATLTPFKYASAVSGTGNELRDENNLRKSTRTESVSAEEGIDRSHSNARFGDTKTHTQRVARSETKAAELLATAAETNPNILDALKTPLFQRLKARLPSTKIGDTTYYFAEGDRRLNEEQLMLHAKELEIQYAKWKSLQEVDPSLRASVSRFQAELVSEAEGGKSVRWKVNATLNYCVLRRSFGSGPEADERYRAIVAEFKKATEGWTTVERTSVPPFVHKSELDNSPLTGIPDGVTFAVTLANLPNSVIASAFFPNDPQAEWNVYVSPTNYFGSNLAFDRIGVLRHELGHVLGFRHEHPRSEAPLVCQTNEIFDGDVIPLTEYDPVSVMHYFCRGFNNPQQETLNQERRKLKLTEVDKRALRLIYPPHGESSGLEYKEFNPVRVRTNRPTDTDSALSLPSPSKPPIEIPQLTSNRLESARELWMEPQDTSEAINHPDLYAWKLFVALNWPADLAKRAADPSRSFAENADTVWESWKLSSGMNDQVFLKDGVHPGPWIDGGGPGAIQTGDGTPPRRIGDFEKSPLQQAQRQRSKPSNDFDDDRSTKELNENHLNRAAYEFICDQELFNIEGQEKLFQDKKKIFDEARKQKRSVAPHEFKVHFPVGAKEVKTQWRRITSEDKPRYRWAEFTASDGSKILFGLTAMHITTKDIPNWFWATFEHTDNTSREGAECWHLPTVDSSAGSKGYPEKLGIEGTRWENYRLRGTQVDFVNSFGQPTLLANSQIESGFQLTSSCITCHARAAIGPRIAGTATANRLSIFKTELPQTLAPSIVTGSVGSLPEDIFVQRTFNDEVTGELRYLQLDFVWSLMRAQSKVSSEPLPATVSFAQHIRPLFRQKDIDSMKRVFDLSQHADVNQHAAGILLKLEDRSMPCDGPWPSQNVSLFKKWIEGGKQP